MAALNGLVAVVTGASGGIGRAIALKLAKQGASLCLLGRRTALLDELLEEVREHTPGSRCYALDLTSDAEVARFAGWVDEVVGAVDILVHSAGVIAHGTVEATSIEDFDRHFATNVRAPFLLTQALLPRLRARRGQVVFVNSTAGLVARGGVAAYCASKHALKSLADSLRDEVNRDGVRVLSIYPGRTAGSLQADLHKVEGKAYDPERLMRPEDTAELVGAALTLPRSAEVTEITTRPAASPK